jgi:hypothetical protein
MKFDRHLAMLFYDSSPYGIDTQRGRLKPACSLSDAHIKCLLWGEDALAYVHFILTGLFDLHLVVQDGHIEMCEVLAITCESPDRK